ncbi:MAG TPA: glycosyl hydrolase, partial [Blastocatellia bacterium]|nr:glycosyl hydrolase [Blastocatellia bacterium]
MTIKSGKSGAMMRRFVLVLSLAAGLALSVAVFSTDATRAQQTAASNPLAGLRYRNIGPFRGGRSVAVAGVTSQPNVYYFGSVGGGVFKSTDGGDNWTPVSDGQPFGTGTVGAIAVSESDPNVVYVGMGEACIRGNYSHGDGVYKSTDAGKTWKRVGLEDTRIVGKIKIHPKNPDVVYVAALGHAAGTNDERGVFKSTDGGKSWKKVLFKSNKAGAVDLSLDPANPNVIYASIWEAKRTPYSLESGGPDSGLWKSTDGGDTWKDISRNPGLPKGTLGKIGVAVSPANPERVYANVEAEDGGVFSSSDAGATWTKVSTDRNLRQRAWYYT